MQDFSHLSYYQKEKDVSLLFQRLGILAVVQYSYFLFQNYHCSSCSSYAYISMVFCPSVVSATLFFYLLRCYEISLVDYVQVAKYEDTPY